MSKYHNGMTTVEDLTDILAMLRSEPRSRITSDTLLREDLGVNGDDWDEILVAITQRWGETDFTSFNFYDYFREEPQLHALYIWLKDFWNGKCLRPLTVGHLAAVIDRGQWFEPEPLSA
jgi:hypothetical protein